MFVIQLAPHFLFIKLCMTSQISSSNWVHLLLYFIQLLSIGHIQEECVINSIINSPTVIFEDNTDCIEQVSEGFIKEDRTKHIAS